MPSKNLTELQLVSTKKAAKALGIGYSTLTNWISYGRFPYVKVGRRTLVRVQDLDAFIERNLVEEKISLDAA